MVVNLPQEMDQFVKELVLSGQFSSEEAVITESLRVFMSHEQLRSDVAKGFRQIDEGNWIDGDVMFDQLHAMIDDIGAEKRGDR